jgi:hypothetical protein
LFIANVCYRGLWRRDKHYKLNDIVRTNNATYIGLDTIPKGIAVTDEHYWGLICKDHHKSGNIIESYNQTTEDVPHHNDIINLTTDIDFDIKNLLNTSNCGFKHDNKFYYASKQSNITHSLNSKKAKWNIPLLFEKLIDGSQFIDHRKGQIIFNKTGKYKVTIHVKYIGTSHFKVVGYLLRPSDNAQSDTYQKDRQIIASQMVVIGPAQIKNYLHYSFITNVKDVLSTLVIMSVHHSNRQNNGEIIIFGKSTTWILIEKLY